MSTGSYDEGSNLVRETTSPTSGPEEVFDKSEPPQQSADSDSPDSKKHSPHLPSSPLAKGLAHSSSSPKQSPVKKSKASKGLGFLLKARDGNKRDGNKKGRSKSPLSFSKSPLKSKKTDDDDDEFLKNSNGDSLSETDDKSKAKSEHWQAFLQMQDRIKQNVLKTQTSISKHVPGRVSPSGRISPAKDKDSSDSVPFSVLKESDTNSSDLDLKDTPSNTSGFVKESIDTQPSFDNSTEHSNLLSASHSITVSSPSPPSAFQSQTNFSMDMDAFGDILGQPNNTPVLQSDQTDSAQKQSAVDEFDLLGLSSDHAPINNESNMAKQSSINEDLLGLDDFTSYPTSRDVSHDNLSSDWFGGSSTAQSSAQSSLCPSPVDFDFLMNPEKMKTESTAVSDLARSLVNDFLQWGANNSDEPLSKNPFQTDDFTSDQTLAQNSFNPFATIVESDDPDSQLDGLGGFGDKDNQRNSDGNNLLSDPFFADSEPPPPMQEVTGNVPFDPFAPVTSHPDGPLDINANAAMPAPIADFLPAEHNMPPLRPAQPPKGRKTARKSSNPFIISDDDFVDGKVEFDDNFFASRGIFHAAPEKESEDNIWGVGNTGNPGKESEDNIWGVGNTGNPGKESEDNIWGVGNTGKESSTSTAFVTLDGADGANPFQDDLFTADTVKQMKDTTTTVGLLDIGQGSEPINPFLTASCENIALQTPAQPLKSDNPFAAMLAGSPTNCSPIPPVATNALDDFLKPQDPVPAPVADNNNDIFDPFASSQPADNLVDTESSNKNLMGDENTLDIFGEQSGDVIGNDDDDDDEKDEKVVRLKLDIKEKCHIDTTTSIVPALPPPPKPPKSPQVPRENPFNKESPPEENFASFTEIEEELRKKDEAKAAEEVAAKDKKERMQSMTSEDSTPDEEGSLEPLEPFYFPEKREFWKLMVRHPMKKKLGGNRFWKQAIVKMGHAKDGPVIRLYMDEKDTDPFQELPLQPCYSVSDISMQQYDQFGKIHTLKVQYIFYRERVGIRPERITTSLVRKPKPNMILDHSPQVSELIKMGSLDYDEVISFQRAIQDTLMRLSCHRDKPLTYTKDEVQADVWDEYQAVIDKDGHVKSQKGRVRIFFLAFLTGMPVCELGISDRRRKGKEVVGRHDIIPVRTEDWIRIEDAEFHHVVDLETYEKTHNLRFHPLDACQFELVRFRVRPKENKELPLQLKVTQAMKARKFEIRVNLLVTGYHAFSKKCGQFPCEDIEVRIKIPEVWIYYFRYEKRFGYGSLKAMARKPGKIKGLERITMMAQGLLTPALMEASVGSAKYEHLYRSVIWRIPRLPERNHGAYKNHMFVLNLNLGLHDEIPDTFDSWADVTFTMPASTVSKAQVRSISVENPNPPEKWVRYVAKYHYQVEIDNHVATGDDNSD